MDATNYFKRGDARILDESESSVEWYHLQTVLAERLYIWPARLLGCNQLSMNEITFPDIKENLFSVLFFNHELVH